MLAERRRWLPIVHQGLNYLTGGSVPQRMGTGHPNTAPYQAFATADGFIIMGTNNDAQFERFCALAGREDLSSDPRYATNAARVRNRVTLLPEVQQILKGHPSAYWIEELAKINVMCGPINTIDEVFSEPQVQARAMKISMPHRLAGSGSVDLIGNPIKMSATPVDYRQPPPTLGEHTDVVLEEVLGLDAAERQALRDDGVI